MATYQHFDVFAQDLAHKVHDLSNDTLKVALVSSGNPPEKTDAVLSDLITTDMSNIQNDAFTIASSGEVDGVYTLDLENLQLEANGGSVGPFRYVAVYNDSSPNGSLICWFDFEEDITIPDGQFLVLLIGPLGLFSIQPVSS